jgi:exonuclease III
MLYTGKSHILFHEIDRLKLQIDLVGISETHWIGKGEFCIGDYLFVYSGNDELHREGVAIVLSKDARACLLGYELISSRIMCVYLQTQIGKCSIIQVYAPTLDSDDIIKDKFYDDLNNLIQSVSSKHLTIVMGDFNAKVGNEHQDWPSCLGKFGLESCNANGERLLQFCTVPNLSITNIMFRHKFNKKWTWSSEDGRYKNMIDYILINRKFKSSVCNTCTLNSASLDTDHKLIGSVIRLKLKKCYKTPPLKKFDISKLSDPAVVAAFQ